MKKIGIIGAGPAGMMAAGMAAKNNDNEVVLFDKNNRIGKKLFITGKGRCNVTNAAPIEEFLDNIPTNKYFMYSSLYSFTNENAMEFFKDLGLDLKIERGNRVFPKSDKSMDVVDAFERFIMKNKVDLRLNSKVENVEYDGEHFIVSVNDESIYFDKLLIATGGISYPGTGSNGEGHEYAKRFGHEVTDLKPSLVPISLDNSWLKDLQGLSLKNVNLKVYDRKKLVDEEFGEMLFTHFGVSGPIVLSMSSRLHDIAKENIRISIDLKPALDKEKLDNRILRDFEKYSNKHISNGLVDLLPQKLINVVLNKSNISPDTEVHQITREERERLVDNIKDFSMNFKDFRSFSEAIVTKGGINVDEINPSTMESKIIPGLYFAGEIIDVDAYTGGFNLQIAYSTGYLAGINM